MIDNRYQPRTVADAWNLDSSDTKLLMLINHSIGHYRCGDALSLDQCLDKILNEFKDDNLMDVAHPTYYGGQDDPFEAIKVMYAWGGFDMLFWFAIGSATKYISRAGKKDGESYIKDRSKMYVYFTFIKEYLNGRL